MTSLLVILGIILVGIILIWRRKRIRQARVNRLKALKNGIYPEPYFGDDVVDLPQINHPQNNEPILTSSVGESHDAFSKTENLPKKKSELLIVLYVVTQRQSGFAGTNVLATLETMGLRYGHMNIFHHYGVGELKAEDSVFSIANMIEPGTLNPHEMSHFSTPGLALFMRLPGPFGGRVAFELMLNNAQRLANELDGYIEDEIHMPLDPKKTSAIRERIANFEQRNASLY